MRLKVLIAEDDVLQADILAHALEQRGVFADVVHTGMDAVRRARFGVFDIALIDYRLPDIDGVAVARLIRGMEGLISVPQLIAVTAAPRDVTARSSARFKGFDALLSKPLSVPAIMAKMHHCLTMSVRYPGPLKAGADYEAAADAPESAAPSSLTVVKAERPQPAPAKPPLGRPWPQEGVHDKRPRVRSLVVDDDGPLRSILRMALEAEGHVVECAADGLEALQKIHASSFDVALIDYQMPELDGLATARLIYDLLGQPDRPRLVALTGEADTMMQSDPQYGALFDEVVTKVQGVPAVLMAVRRSLQYNALRRAHATLADAGRIRAMLSAAEHGPGLPGLETMPKPR
jgi:CheY-like chemotaxis protein